MFSIRFPDDLKSRLEALAEKRKVTKSDIVKEAIQEYLERQEDKADPYRLGEDLFGKHGSGAGNLSQEYKYKVREKIHEKNAD